MRAYAYRSALYCEPCGLAIIAREFPAWPNGEDPQYDTGDSNDYPQGPYADGGGEADSPHHCDACMALLENPLTDDGMAYVRNVVAVETERCGKLGRPVSELVAEWSAFYGVA